MFISINRLALSLVSTFALFAPALPYAQQTQADTRDLTVLYTGKLYGYLRVEGCEPLTKKDPARELKFDPCIDPTTATEETLKSLDQDKNAVSCFLEKLRHEKPAGSRSVLVGMGDNFGPRLEARMEKDTGPTTIAGEWWKPRSKNPSDIEVTQDPVGCFLRVAQYDAVVPGREDFNLGPERIRNIANFLDNPALFSQGGKKVPILGSNLVFNVHYKDPGDPVPENQKKLDFNSFSSLPQFQMQSSEPFLPTLRYLEFRATLGIEVSSGHTTEPTSLVPMPSAINPVPLDLNPSYLFSSLKGQGHVTLCGPYNNLDALKPGPCIWLDTPEIYDGKVWVGLQTGDLALQLDECSSSIRDAARDSGKPLQEIRDTSLPRTQSKCRLVKKYLSGGDVDLAKPVAPSVRLRWRVNALGLPPSTGADFVPDQSYRFCLFADQTTKGVVCQRLPIRRPLFQEPYVYLADKQVVIFGVVDPNLRAQLTDTQGSWLEAKAKDYGRKVEIESVDPHAALVQAQDAFTAERRAAGETFTGRKILLAQMDSHAAEDLAASLEGPYAVDLTIAQADRIHRTPPDETVTLTLAKAGNLPVLVPLPISGSAGKDLDYPLASALLSQNATHISLTTSNLSKALDKADDKLKSYPLTEKSYFIGINCPSPQSLKDVKPDPKMLGLLRCVAKDYLLKIAEDEKVVSNMPLVPSSGSEFTEAVLQVMRHRSATDLAVLERHELYGVIESSNQDGDPDQPDHNNPKNLRKFLDRILWENATMQKLAVTGATLKRVLKQSDVYKAQEESSTERVALPGRALMIAGLKKGPGKDEYFINGKAVEDSTQYSIAVSDRLLSVDSDYPDLRKDLAGKTAEISRYKAEYISFAVCQAFTNIPFSYFSNNVSCAPGNSDPRDYQRPEDRLFAETPLCVGSTYLQGLLPDLRWCAPDHGQSTANMIDSSHGIGFLKRFFDSFALPSFRPAPAGPLDLPLNRSTSLQAVSELADQFQRTHRFQISELSFSFSTHNPDENAQQLSSAFSSAVLSTVNQARSSTWEVKNTARFMIGHYGLLGHGLDAYASDDIAFSSQDQDQTGAFPHKITLNKNQWAVVPYGLSWSFSRSVPEFFHRKPDRLLPDINLVLELTRFSGQFIGTDNFITVSQAPTSGVCNGTLKNGVCNFSIDPVQQPTLSYSPRVGIRLESLSSYFEFGSQNSRDWRIPAQYIFNSGSAAPIPCSADQLQSCVLANSISIDPAQRIRQINTARWQSAFYIDSVYKFPVPKIKKMFYVMKNKGEYYWNRSPDTQVLTKYDYTMTNSLSIPIRWNISLEPTAELFWYENKIALNDLFKRSYSVKLNYTIDWGIRRVKFREASKASPFAQIGSTTSQ